jgi:DNA polymerase III alpha subunit (gram-positive type)
MKSSRLANEARAISIDSTDPGPQVPPPTGEPTRQPQSKQTQPSGRDNKSAKPQRQYKRMTKAENMIWGRLNPELKSTPIKDVNSESGTVVLEGDTFGLETREVSQGTRVLVKFAIN